MATPPQYTDDALMHIATSTTEYEPVARALACELIRARATIKQQDVALQRANKLEEGLLTTGDKLATQVDAQKR